MKTKTIRIMKTKKALWTKEDVKAVNKVFSRMAKRKKQGISGLDMCQIISALKILKDAKSNTHPTPEEIWNYSATGELMGVYIWREAAKEILREYAHPKYAEKYGFIIPNKKYIRKNKIE